jgi:hypothetical protein
MTLSANAGPGPRDGLTSDDVEDLAEYFEHHFRNHALLQALNAVGFWRHVVDLAPRLPATERAALFAPLWGSTAHFTNTCSLLIGGLAALGFAATGFCGLDALEPRGTSIINVRTLFTLGGPPSGELAVRTASGISARIARPVLAALVAELTVPLAERPWSFFDTTDLLDFPGARTRGEITDLDRFLAQPERLGGAFLRGKVAYLFQRYNAEQEITAMLLCVGPSTQEVQTLPRMVQDWIKLTIGDSPEARERQSNSLFLILTKFDAHFEEKDGEEAKSDTRWTARLQANFIDFFGKIYDWPSKWSPDRPFSNTFWLRNPAIRSGAVFDYGPAPSPGERGRELGVATRASAFVADLRAAYLANSLVQMHVADAADAWDAALLPEDGGITRLATALAPVCNPSLKSRQIRARTEELASEMAERLRPHWRSDDRAAELVQARLRATAVVRALVNCARAQMFGALLRSLQVTQEQVAGVHWRMQTDYDDQPAPIGAVGGAALYDDELSGILASSADHEAPERSKAPFDYFDRFADLVLATWDEAMHSFAADVTTQATFHLPAEQSALLVDQISAAARRKNLRGTIADALRQHAGFHGRASAGAGKMVLLAEDTINGFVTYLGFDREQESKRPQVGPAGAQRRVFAKRPAIRGLPQLGELPTPYDRIYHLDWMASFARMMEDNVIDLSAETIDVAANDALGEILTKLVVRPETAE